VKTEGRATSKKRVLNCKHNNGCLHSYVLEYRARKTPQPEPTVVEPEPEPEPPPEKRPAKERLDGWLDKARISTRDKELIREAADAVGLDLSSYQRRALRDAAQADLAVSSQSASQLHTRIAGKRKPRSR